MPGFKITSFKGAVPKLAPRLLAPEFAQTALNARLENGDLKSYGAITIDSPLEPIGRKSNSNHREDDSPTTIYKYHTGPTTSHWLHWMFDVDVVQSPIVNDSTDRLYYTYANAGIGYDEPMQMTNNELVDGDNTGLFNDDILDGTVIYRKPYTSYKVGIAKPTIAPTIEGWESSDPDSLDLEQRFYVYTYVNSNGEESAPSSPSERVYALLTEFPELSVTIPTIAAGFAPLEAIRLYVTATGSNATDFQFCKETTTVTGGVTIIDGGTRAEVLPTKTWVPPDPNLKGLTAMANGVLAGFDGNTLMFSEPYIPYAWPIEYQLGVPYEIVGLGRAGDQLVVCTTGTPYLASGATSASMDLIGLSVEQACVSKRSIVSILDGVIYASPDGLVYVSSGGAELLTKDLITRAQWSTYNPSSIHAYQHDNLYYAFNGTGGFIFNPVDKHFVTIDLDTDAAFNDIITDTLYVYQNISKLLTSPYTYPYDGANYPFWNIAPWTSDTTDDTFTWTSKVFITERPTILSTGQVVFTAGGGTTSLTLTIDGTALSPIAVTADATGVATFRLPSGSRGTHWEITLSGTSAIEAVYFADSVSGLSGIQ